MMKKLLAKVCAAALLVTFMLSGCSSVEHTAKFNTLGVAATPVRAVSHLNSTIYGYYLFGIVPVLSGSVGRSDTTALFTDTVTLDNALLQMNLKAKAMGASRVIDLESNIASEWIWYSLLFSRKEVQISGTAIE